MYTMIQKWGNSLALRIPEAFARKINLAEKAKVDISLDKGKIVINPLSMRKHSQYWLLKGVTKKNLHGEIVTGKPVGREVIYVKDKKET
jgi:antitoxin MazE